MFKKSKERKLAALQSAWAAQEKALDKEIEAAVKVEDPADRILALRIVEKEIELAFAKDDLEQHKRDGRRTGVGAVATSVGTTAATFGVALGLSAIAPPLGLLALPVMIGSFVGGMTAMDKADSRANEKHNELVGGFRHQLYERIKLVHKEMDKTVEENATELAKSMKYGDVMRDERLSRIFADVSARYMAEKNTPPALGMDEEPNVIGHRLEETGREQRERFSSFIKLGQDSDPVRKKPQPPKGPTA